MKKSLLKKTFVCPNCENGTTITFWDASKRVFGNHFKEKCHNCQIDLFLSFNRLYYLLYAVITLVFFFGIKYLFSDGLILALFVYFLLSSIVCIFICLNQKCALILEKEKI
tara:strand:- start:38130 stop:38462 length:333 start_codon:yes stop_codon:yes gene_type:complete